MDKKQNPLITPILWAVGTALCCVKIGIDLYLKSSTDGITIILMLLFLGCAISNFMRYRKEKQHKEKTEK